MILDKYVGAKIEVKNFEQGPPVIAPIEVRIAGDNLNSLRSLPLKVENLLHQTKGTIYVNNPINNLKSDIKVSINKEKARMLGVNTVGMDRTVRMAISAINMGSFSDASNAERDIILTTPKKERATLDAFDNLYINNQFGKAISLSQIVTLSLESSPLFINHYNKARTVSNNAFVQKDFLVDNVLKDAMNQMDYLKLPDGYHYTMD